jgi:mRNA-degrading endonuclease RelE of RelBE toxin-antitoxin system
MLFQVIFIPSAETDLDFFKVSEQRVIVDAIRTYLQVDATAPSQRRKQLSENPIAPWELRVGRYRVFYELENDAIVKIVAVGYKDHNDLFIRGESVEL